jgi:hypothetical protein
MTDGVQLPLALHGPQELGPEVPIVLCSTPVMTTAVYDTYWRFACERQDVFFRRLSGSPPPWTEDHILQQYKFTNAYRASDRTSQYLIRNVIYRQDLPRSPVEVFFRIMLFKLFNKIETWELLERCLGKISYEDYRFDRYDTILTKALRDNQKIYSAAYIMPPGGHAFGHPAKHQNHLRLLELLIADSVPDRLTDVRTMREGFHLLRSYPTIGNFLAYQFIIDVNYSELIDFDESEFVVPGPGCRDGLRKCFTSPGSFSDEELVRFVSERQDLEFERRGLLFQSLWGRSLQLIDCQSLFCEVDKYARARHPDVVGYSGRRRIKQRFAKPKPPIRYWYPPKWRINEHVGTDTTVDPRTANA